MSASNVWKEGISQFPASRPLVLLTGRRREARRRVLAAVTVAVFLLGFAGTVPAGEADDALKARFLVNFALYTYWPAPAFVDNRSPVNICLYGTDPFGRVLDRTAEARKYVVGGHRRRSLNVWRTRTVAELTDCHVVFVSGVKVNAELIDRISAPYRLIVGESRLLTRHGGHIDVYQGDDGMQFDVNLEAVSRADLSLSSQLLRLANTVTGPVGDLP